MSESLEQLVEAARGDGRRAFGALLRRFQAMAVASAYARLGDRGLAHDVAQEAFTDAYLHLDQLREPRAFPSWLGRIVHKHCDRIWRRRSLSTVALDGVAEPSGEADAPDLSLDRARESARLWEAVEALPEPQRLVVALHYLGGEKIKDIATLLELPPGTAVHSAPQARRGPVRHAE